MLARDRDRERERNIVKCQIVMGKDVIEVVLIIFGNISSGARYTFVSPSAGAVITL